MQTTALLPTLLLLIGGLVNCFAGFRLFRLVLALWGFLVGVSIVAAVFEGINELAIIGLALLAGLIGAGVFSLFYAVGVVLLGLVFGFGLGVSIANLLGLESGLAFLVGAAVAVAFGALAMRLARLIIIVTSAFAGAAAIVAAGLVLTGTDPAATAVAGAGPLRDERELLGLGVTIVLGIIGTIVQLLTTEADE